MEYRDLYDENKRHTGERIAAGDPIPQGRRILCAGCWVIDRSGRIFLTRRSPEKRFMPDKWENTGGHAIAGEDGKDAALRELFEETGIRAERSDLVLLGERTGDRCFTEDYAVIKSFPLTEVVLQQGETCDAAWVSEARWEEMLRSGEIAPSVNENLQPFKQKLLDLLHSL